MKTLLFTFFALLLVNSAKGQGLPFLPALLSGQSNAVFLSPYLPLGSHYLVAESGQPIAA